MKKHIFLALLLPVLFTLCGCFGFGSTAGNGNGGGNSGGIIGGGSDDGNEEIPPPPVEYTRTRFSNPL